MFVYSRLDILSRYILYSTILQFNYFHIFQTIHVILILDNKLVGIPTIFSRLISILYLVLNRNSILLNQ